MVLPAPRLRLPQRHTPHGIRLLGVRRELNALAWIRSMMSAARALKLATEFRESQP